MKPILKNLIIFYFIALLLIVMAISFYADSLLRTKNIYGKSYSTNNLVNIKGEQVAMSDITHAQINIIDYWFKGCKPCIKEMKLFPQLLEEYENLKIVSVSIDPHQLWVETINDRSIFGTHSNWEHFNYASKKQEEPWAMLNNKPIGSYPTYVLITKDGEITRVSSSISKLLISNKYKIHPALLEACHLIIDYKTNVIAFIFALILTMLKVIMMKIYSRTRQATSTWK